VLSRNNSSNVSAVVAVSTGGIAAFIVRVWIFPVAIASATDF
jgi:hypothetical protein